VFCGGEYPSSALELEDATKSLNPEGIDHIPLGFLPLYAIGHHDIVINRVCDQSDPLDFFHLLCLPESYPSSTFGRKFIPFFLFFGIDKLHFACRNFSKSGHDGPVIGLD
jgi:hypothetical protein